MTLPALARFIRSGRPELRQGVLRLRNRVDSCPRNEAGTPEIVEEELPGRVDGPLCRAVPGPSAPLRRGVWLRPGPIESP